MKECNVSAIILAAGKGTRMNSAYAKVIHEVFFKPMIHHVLDAIAPLQTHLIVVVTGHQAENVEQICAGYDVVFARQKVQLGTGHAVRVAEPFLVDTDTDVVIILCGDTPLIRTQTLQSMLNEHISNAHPISVMTTVTKDPTNYGRIILDEAGFIRAIVEEKDATPEQRQITEVNAGIYCVERNFLFTALKNIGTDNKQQEYYLTDIVTTAHSTGLKVNRFLSREADELLGVNSRQELSLAHAIHQKRFICQLMGQGVTCILPETITIGGNVQIGRDTVISSHVVITGQSIIGDGCYIAPFSCLRDCRLGHNVVVGEFSYLNGITLGDNESVLPCSRIHKNVFQKQYEGV